MKNGRKDSEAAILKHILWRGNRIYSLDKRRRRAVCAYANRKTSFATCIENLATNAGENKMNRHNLTAPHTKARQSSETQREDSKKWEQVLPQCSKAFSLKLTQACSTQRMQLDAVVFEPDNAAKGGLYKCCATVMFRSFGKGLKRSFLHIAQPRH